MLKPAVYLTGAKANRLTSNARNTYIPYWSWESHPSATFFDIARKASGSFEKVKYYINKTFFIGPILLSAINLSGMYLIKLSNQSSLTRDMTCDSFFFKPTLLCDANMVARCAKEREYMRNIFQAHDRIPSMTDFTQLNPTLRVYQLGLHTGQQGRTETGSGRHDPAITSCRLYLTCLPVRFHLEGNQITSSLYEV
jgi:hypothetical protein